MRLAWCAGCKRLPSIYRGKATGRGQCMQIVLAISFLHAVVIEGAERVENNG